MAKPPITGTTHELPFEKLSPRDFERMCLWLVRREGYPTAEHHGAAGSDRGRDLVAQREKGLTAFQCKRVGEFGPSDAEDAVHRILAPFEDSDTGEAVTPPTPTRIILMIGCDVSVAAREKAERAAGEIPCEVWARTELDERVHRHQGILKEFFSVSRHAEIRRDLGPQSPRRVVRAITKTLEGIDRIGFKLSPLRNQGARPASWPPVLSLDSLGLEASTERNKWALRFEISRKENGSLVLAVDAYADYFSIYWPSRVGIKTIVETLASEIDPKTPAVSVTTIDHSAQEFRLVGLPRILKSVDLDVAFLRVDSSGFALTAELFTPDTRYVLKTGLIQRALDPALVARVFASLGGCRIPENLMEQTLERFLSEEAGK